MRPAERKAHRGVRGQKGAEHSKYCCRRQVSEMGRVKSLSSSRLGALSGSSDALGLGEGNEEGDGLGSNKRIRQGHWGGSVD